MPAFVSGIRTSGVSLARRIVPAAALMTALLPLPAISAQNAAPEQQLAPQTAAPQTTPPQTAPPAAVPASQHDELAIAEEQLRQQFQGKSFYLRSGYIENSLHFTADGKPDGAVKKGSYTLSLIEIDSVHLEKHKLVLEGSRYGLHFLGALASEDQSSTSEKVKISTKKNPVKIEIDREDVDLSFDKKAAKEAEKEKKKLEKNPKPAQPAPAAAANAASAPAATPAPDTEAKPAPASETKPAIAAQQPAEATRHGVPVTTSVAHANKTLREALDRIFAPSAPALDDRMMAALPDYWQLYYKAVAARADYRPSDPAVLRQSQVDQKARLLRAIDPPSNDFAQANGIVGLAMYHVVVGADGKPALVVIGRPIGFGLDESAVDMIRKAEFQPAVLQGKPVPVLVDMTVQFRIYSKLTNTPRPSAEASTPPESAAPPAVSR